MKPFIGQHFIGTACGVTHFGVFVELEEPNRRSHSFIKFPKWWVRIWCSQTKNFQPERHVYFRDQSARVG